MLLRERRQRFNLHRCAICAVFLWVHAFSVGLSFFFKLFCFKFFINSKFKRLRPLLCRLFHYERLLPPRRRLAAPRAPGRLLVAARAFRRRASAAERAHSVHRRMRSLLFGDTPVSNRLDRF